MSWRLAALAVVTSLLVAGCAGSEEIDEAGGPAPLVGDDAGAIVGVVVDDDLLPIAKADVGLDDGVTRAVTDSSGAFRLDGIAPGTYGIFATALGYGSSGQQVTVVAGQATEVRMTLDRLAIVEPYNELTIRNGYWTCAVATLAAVPNCGVVVESDGNSEHWYGFTVGPSWNTTVIEIAWQYSNAGQQTTPGAWFSNFGVGLDDESHTFGEFFGDNPLKAQYYPDQPITAYDGEERDRFPSDGYDHYGYVFPWGILAEESQPVYSIAFGSYSRGVGVSISQPFTVYATVFYHGPPSGDYSALPDA